MSRVFWVRHGPTHARGMVGWSDLPADLSDTAALRRLDAHLPAEALLVSSDLSRAVETARAVQGGREMLPPERDLREIHFGDWELADFDRIEDQERLRAFWDNPGDVRPPGGESWHEVSKRVSQTLARLRGVYADRDLVIVAHMGVILTQVQEALAVSAYEAFGHRIDNLSVTELHHDGHAWQAVAINHRP